MRAIITGGTGLIGRALTADLAAAGYEVIILSRNPGSAPPLPPHVQVVEWDARTAAGWGHLADGAGAIVNLAGATISRPWTEAHKRRIAESRLNAGQALVEAVSAAQIKPRVLVQSSGISYYGPRGDQLVTEALGPGDDYLGRTAVEWEASTAAVEEMGVRRPVLRTGLVLSAEGGILPVWALPFRLFLGASLGRGDQGVAWIHMVDEVRAIRFLMESEDAHGPFNLVAPNPATNAEFSRRLAKILRRPCFFRVPAFALRLALGEMSTLVLEGQRAVPHRLQELGFIFHFPELEAALRDLLEA
ncbi:MAG: TIGR01777 family oxidoreductase [Anaerolineae bacterium]|jgi:hypothetical protein